MTCTLALHPGRNVWVLARTDLDGASHEDVLKTAANVMHHFLRPVTPFGQQEVFEHLIRLDPVQPGAEARYIIGAARPVELSAVQVPLDGQFPRLRIVPACRAIKRREDCDVLFTLAAQQPWGVIVNFDWRGPLVQMPWPRRRVNLLGFAVESEDELQWLLMEACWMGEALEPDTTLADDLAREWSEATREGLQRLAEPAKQVATRIAQGLFVGLGLYWGVQAIRRARKNRARLPE